MTENRDRDMARESMTTTQLGKEVDAALAASRRITAGMEAIQRFMGTVPSKFTHLPDTEVTVTDLAHQDDDGEVTGFELGARHLFATIEVAGAAMDAVRARSSEIIWGDPLDRPCAECAQPLAAHGSGKASPGHPFARPDIPASEDRSAVTVADVLNERN